MGVFTVLFPSASVHRIRMRSPAAMPAGRSTVWAALAVLVLALVAVPRMMGNPLLGAITEPGEYCGSSAIQPASGTRAPLVVPYFQGQRAHPVGLRPEHAEATLNLRGPQDLAQWIAAHEALNLAKRLELDDAGGVTDIDTVQDLERAAQMLRAGV